MPAAKKAVRLVTAEELETPVVAKKPAVAKKPVVAKKLAVVETPPVVETPAVAETVATETPEAVPTGPRLRITLFKSGTGYKYDQKRTLVALGLRRLHATVERPDNASIRGMLTKVQHLVRVEEIGQS